MTLTKSFLSPTFLCFPRLAPATIISFALCLARLISCVYKIGQFNIEPNVILHSCHGFSRSVSVLLDFILEDIRARYDLLMSWLYQEYNASESEETGDEMEFSQSYCDCLLSLMDGLYSSLDPKDKYVSMSVFVCFMFFLYSLLVIRKVLFFAGFQVPGVEMQEDFRLCCPLHKLFGPGPRFSKVPKTFRARKAIRKTATRLFCKAGFFICCKGN